MHRHLPTKLRRFTRWADIPPWRRLIPTGANGRKSPPRNGRRGGERRYTVSMNLPTTPGTWRAALLALFVGASSSAVAEPGTAKGGAGKTHVAARAAARVAKKAAPKKTATKKTAPKKEAPKKVDAPATAAPPSPAKSPAKKAAAPKKAAAKKVIPV